MNRVLKMHKFFNKISQNLRNVPIIRFSLLGLVGVFAAQRLQEIARKKEALIEANPDKKVIIKPPPGNFLEGWSWGLDDATINPAPPNVKPPT